MEKHLDFDKKGSEQWVGDEKREETEYEDDTESEESCASTDGWKGKGREQNCSPAELFSTSWIDITVSPALSEMPITPGDQIEFSIALKEGINLVGFEARLVGRSELANGSQHEFLSVPSVPAEFDSSLLYSLNNSTWTSKTLTFCIFMLFNHTCGCGVSRLSEAPPWIPLPPSYAALGNKIEYFVELIGKVETGNKDRKGKGKWKLFSGKTKNERFEIPLILDTDCMYDPLEPSPPHLAPERFYRTQPVSQERDHGRERTTHVDLSAPLNVGFAARAETATLNLEMTTSPTYPGSPTLPPSFRYSLIVSLGRHPPSSIPLLLVSLKHTALHAHFVLHKSITLLPSPSTSKTAGKESSQQAIWIQHRDKRKPNPTDAGRQTALEPGTVDGEFELYTEKGERFDLDGQEELLVKFEGEFEVDIWARTRGEDRRLTPIRTCQLEITYDLTTTIRFGPNFFSSIQLKSTNLPFHLEARKIPLIDSSSTSVVPAASSSKDRTVEKPSRVAFLKSPPSSQGPASSSCLESGDNLPSYVPTQSSTSPLPSAAEEKRQLANLHETDGNPSTSTTLPPAYNASSDPSSLSLSSLAVDEGVSEDPPSWEEAVKEEAMEEWVAANACLGEGT